MMKPLIAIVMLHGLLLFAIRDGEPTRTQQAKPPAVPLYEGLGSHSRSVSNNAQAQRYFDQGLAFLYAFNHDEAVQAFKQATTLDPDCAMAWWGIALANGIHINKPVLPAERAKAAWTAIEQAKKKLNPQTKPVDQALIHALSKRYTDKVEADRTPWESAYRTAMKEVWTQYPQDADVGALYCESIMNLRPWDLWTNDGKPQPDTLELVATLETVMKLNPVHPLALHLYIHAVEASPEPGKATEGADRLRTLQPGLGHLVHMPSHIDVRCGRWQQAIEANQRAIVADSRYTQQSPRQDFYRLYMAHNQHMLAFAAMMSGQSKIALDAINTMLSQIPAEWLAVKENAMIADGFIASLQEVMIRFGKWDEVLKVPQPPGGFPIARTFWHHARGVAYAAKGQISEARLEQKQFRDAAKLTPAEATFGNNTAKVLYGVADPMLEGEILAAEGKLAEAIKQLRTACAAEDQLRYNEPPDWIIPIRHPLGAFLLKAGQAAEAEAVYREDLKKWPNNGWSLHGLAASLKQQGKHEDATQVEALFREAWKNADVSIHASCLCSQ